RRGIAELLSDVAANSGDVTANRLRGNLSAMLSWGMKEGLCDHNVAADTFKRQEVARDRVLSDDELRLIWNALDDDPFGRIVKLLMLTGQRRDEIGGLRWSEVCADRGTLALPKHRTKNKQEHTVPLSEPCRDILERIPRIVSQDTVFASVERGFSAWSKG